MDTTGAGPEPATIQSLSLFSSLTLEECAEVAERTEEREFDRGSYVMHQGDGGFTFFVIQSGTADVFVDDALVRSLGAGDFIGELAILGDGYRTASVVASSPMRLLAFFGLEYRNLEDRHPQISEKIREAVSERLN